MGLGLCPRGAGSSSTWTISTAPVFSWGEMVGLSVAPPRTQIVGVFWTLLPCALVWLWVVVVVEGLGCIPCGVHLLLWGVRVGGDLGCPPCVVHLLLWVAGVGGDQGCHHCGVHLLLCGAGVGGDLGCPSVGETAFCGEKM